jgi:hypothetical protein
MFYRTETLFFYFVSPTITVCWSLAVGLGDQHRAWKPGVRYSIHLLGNQPKCKQDQKRPSNATKQAACADGCSVGTVDVRPAFLNSERAQPGECILSTNIVINAFCRNLTKGSGWLTKTRISIIILWTFPPRLPNSPQAILKKQAQHISTCWYTLGKRSTNTEASAECTEVTDSVDHVFSHIVRNSDRSNHRTNNYWQLGG